MTEHKATQQITINANESEIWNALTNPEVIKQYMFGTHAVSDWKEGSPIRFEGEWQGTKYQDKGIILKFEPEKTFQYSYWSSFSGKEDKEDNYSIVTFHIRKSGKQSILLINQENLANKEAAEHSKNNWEIVLKKIKQILES